MSDRLRAIIEELEIQPATTCSRSAAATASPPASSASNSREARARLTAIDRSPKMIAAATKRNVAHVDAGRAEFLVAELENLAPLDERRFDVVFAVRVGLFHREPDHARALVEAWLKPSGRVHAFFDHPPAAPAESTRRRR